MIRNLLVIAGALLLGLIMMSSLAVAEQYVSEGRSYQGVTGVLFFYALGVLPVAVAASAAAAAAAMGVKTRRPQAWASAVAGTIGFLLILATRYVAPEWAAWFATLIRVVLPSGLAWFVFTLVWRMRNPPLPPA